MTTSWREKLIADFGAKNLLVVGAGGIGCELLKNLVLTGFKKIHVIDLDTIDVSNLNRQFLFRREHVGKSKAEVAVAAVKDLAPDAEITFDHDSIFNNRFGVSWFEQFALVLNALDNRAARVHVNRLCLAARVPLVESGSAGYLGQVAPIIRGKTECFECLPKAGEQKRFPGCTIRNTPSELIHCIVWAKHLFNQLFGEPEMDDDVSPDPDDVEIRGNGVGNEQNFDVSEQREHENVQKNGNGTNGVGAENREKEQKESTRAWAQRNGYNAAMLFDKLFHTDIEYLLTLTNLWKTRRPPVPTRFSDLDDAVASGSNVVQPTSSAEARAKKIWSPAECGQAFEQCVQALKVRAEALPQGQVLVWDKDDEDALHFVVACANVRARAFHILPKSVFDIKSMAGNIIPAIASTNAIVAGMIVVEAIKILRERTALLRNVFILSRPLARSRILGSEPPSAPNPQCYICADGKREIRLAVNTTAMTVKTLEEQVLKATLLMSAPDAQCGASIIISSEPGETAAIAGKPLSEVGVHEGAIIDCDDFSQQLELRLIITHDASKRADDFELLKDSANLEGDKKDEEMESPLTRKRAATDPDAVLQEEPIQKRIKVDGNAGDNEDVARALDG